MVTSSGVVKVLEVNRSPDLECHTRVLQSLIPPMIADTIKIGLGVQHQRDMGAELWPLRQSDGSVFATRFEVLCVS